MNDSIRLAAAVLLISALLSGCGDSERYEAEARFSPAYKNLRAADKELTRVPEKTELSAQPYIKGKIAVFERSQLKSSSVGGGAYNMTIFYFRELGDAYATTPEEAGTVALVNCKMTQKGVYKTPDGKEYPADVEDCELTMIDRAKEAVIFKKMFEKTPSEDRKVYGNSMAPQSAHPDIAQFLKGLPRT